MSDPNEYAATFAMIDIDGDGLISASELQQLMEKLGAEVREEFAVHAVSVIDTDGDGLISLAELTAYLRQPGEGPNAGPDEEPA